MIIFFSFIYYKENKDDTSSVRIVNFDFAGKVPFGGFTGTVHTPDTAHYMAPEIANIIPYGKEVDMWSLGIVLYILLSGYQPFAAKTHEKLIKNIKKGKFKFIPEKTWANVSMAAKDLVSSFLIAAPSKFIDNLFIT